MIVTVLELMPEAGETEYQSSFAVAVQETPASTVIVTENDPPFRSTVFAEGESVAEYPVCVTV